MVSNQKNMFFVFSRYFPDSTSPDVRYMGVYGWFGMVWGQFGDGLGMVWDGFQQNINVLENPRDRSSKGETQSGQNSGQISAPNGLIGAPKRPMGTPKRA